MNKIINKQRKKSADASIHLYTQGFDYTCFKENYFDIVMPNKLRVQICYLQIIISQTKKMGGGGGGGLKEDET